jgi:hypothetical protein
MDRLTHVYDCTGSLIFFGQYVLDCQNNSIKLSNDHYLQAVEVITAPTLIFELKRACPVRYYYRAIGLHKPLLLGVNFSYGLWKLNAYFENTSVSFLLTLLKQHLQDGSITIYLENEMEDNALGGLYK